MVAREHAQLREVAVGHRELASRRQRLEQLDREARLALGVRVVAGEPSQSREPAVRFALAQPVTEPAVLLERSPSGVDRVVDLVREVALVRAPLQELGPALGRELAGEAQRAREVRRGFTVRAERRRTLARRGRVAQHRVPIAGRLGVVSEPREVFGRR
jgi:hypothetical protein